jgi:N utilization substance protein B
VPDPLVRRRARERALQFLFGLEFTRYAWEDAIDSFWDTRPSKPAVRQYAIQLIRGVQENLTELDEEISAALQNWSADRVGRVERAILRIALHEMRHESDVPAAVAMNEAIELAKSFGTDDTPRFVNGVLDRLRRASDDTV